MRTIDIIANDRVVESVIAKMRITKGESRFDLDDLTQDIYVALMSKPESLLGGLAAKRNELEYYIMRMVANNICSSTSPYYQQYKRALPAVDNPDREALKEWQNS